MRSAVDWVDYGAKTYAFTGESKSYVVPNNTSEVTITAWGAGANGVPGGLTIATVPVTSGETMGVIVGGAGKNSSDNTPTAGGYGGQAPGGSGGRGHYSRGFAGSSGAGATYVSHGDGSLVVVAGGAGGNSGEHSNGGAGGGKTGGNADAPGGNPYSGGQGGNQSCSGNPTNGNQGVPSVFGGGGGGGGYCGGNGGGGSHSIDGTDIGDTGGGGGSSFVEKGATAVTDTQGGGYTGNGQILINPPPKVFEIAAIEADHIAVDAKGNTYVTSKFSNNVEMIAPDGSTTQVGSGFKNPKGIAVDDKGIVYVADYGNKAVKTVTPPFNNASHGTIKTIDGGYLRPTGMALDFRGNLYITATSPGNFGDYWALRRINLTTGYDTIVSWYYISSSSPGDVAVDPSCTPSPSAGCGIYTMVTPNNGLGQIWKFNYDGSVSTKYENSSFGGVTPDGGVAVANGQIYVSSNSHNKVVELGSTLTTLGSGWQSPQSIALVAGCKQQCNVFVADTGNSADKVYVP